MKRLVLLSAAWLSLLALSACGVCSDQVLSESSPDGGGVTATVFVRNCGATTDFSTIVSLHGSKDGFRSDRDVVFVVKGRPEVKATWDGPRTLAITCPGCLRANIYRQVTAVADMDIIYAVAASTAR